MLGSPTVMNLPSLHTTGPRLALAAAALAAAAPIAGCGSGSSSGEIGVGHESTANNALIEHVTTPTTPTSGPLSKEPTVTISKAPPPKTLTTRDIIVGTGPEAKTGDPVSVNYVGALYSTGKIFDASWKRDEPFGFTLGQGQTIPGWEKGVIGMHVGGRRELIIPPELAYGKAGHPPTIPPNSTLTFIIDMLST
jgi:FKBP-type peptidyl-prolyl cis-trans isomerase